MTNSDKEDNKASENIFKIMDEIILQLNRTKKMFIIMILTIMIIPPIVFAITFVFFGPPFPFDNDKGFNHRQGFENHFNPLLGIARFIPFLISIIWLGIGIRQWFLLSKWTTKYEIYKELQKKVDKELDYDDNDKEK